MGGTKYTSYHDRGEEYRKEHYLRNRARQRALSLLARKHRPEFLIIYAAEVCKQQALEAEKNNGEG